MIKERQVFVVGTCRCWSSPGHTVTVSASVKHRYFIRPNKCTSSMVFACLVLLHVGCGGFWAYCLHACISIITIQSNPILWSLHAWYSAYQSNPTVCMHASKCGGRPVGHEERDQTACFTKKQNKTKNDTGPRGTRCPVHLRTKR